MSQSGIRLIDLNTRRFHLMFLPNGVITVKTANAAKQKFNERKRNR